MKTLYTRLDQAHEPRALREPSLMDQLAEEDAAFAQLQAVANKMDAENERMRRALAVIVGWAAAYPIKIFGEVDTTYARKLLGEPMYTSLHATWARHLLEGVERYAREGLGQNQNPTPLRSGEPPP